MASVNINLPDDVVAMIDSLVGVDGRADFFADATDAKLRRQKMRAFLQSDEVVMKDEDHPQSL